MPRQKSHLLRYLEAHRAGGFGWQSEFEKSITSARNPTTQSDYAYLCGVYSSLLGRLVSAIGIGNAIRLIGAKDDIDATIEESEKEST